MKGWSSLSEKRACAYANMVFPHGVEVCDAGRCMICTDGVLEEYNDPSAPGYGLFISVGPT